MPPDKLQSAFLPHPMADYDALGHNARTNDLIYHAECVAIEPRLVAIQDDQSRHSSQFLSLTINAKDVVDQPIRFALLCSI
jgi:hypothetical protein